MRKNVLMLIILLMLGAYEDLLSIELTDRAQGIVDKYRAMGAQESDPNKIELNEKNRREWQMRDQYRKDRKTKRYCLPERVAREKLSDLADLRKKIVDSNKRANILMAEKNRLQNSWTNSLLRIIGLGYYWRSQYDNEEAIKKEAGLKESLISKEEKIINDNADLFLWYETLNYAAERDLLATHWAETKKEFGEKSKQLSDVDDEHKLFCYSAQSQTTTFFKGNTKHTITERKRTPNRVAFSKSLWGERGFRLLEDQRTLAE